MYSTVPFFDHTESNIGFYLTCSALLILFIFAFADVNWKWKRFPKEVIAIILVVLPISGFLSFTNFGYEKPKNEKVVGVLIGGYSTESRNMKTHTTSYTNYVTYRVPEGEVSFKRAPGQLYPERAILYRK